MFSTSIFPGLATFRCGLAALTLAATLAGCAAAAESLYVAGAAPLSVAPEADAQVIATLSVAAEVTRLETRDGYHRVALVGWARTGAERVFFAYPGKRILVLRMPSEHTGRLVRLGHSIDPETEISWNRMQIEGWVPEAAAQPRLKPIWDAAWSLFAERCTACHERRVPENYTANQWRSHIKVMGPRTGLPKADQQLILTFLQHHASDTINLRSDARPPAEPTAGR